MSRVTEKLNDTATIKGTMLRAHLAWAEEKLGKPAEVLAPLLDASTMPFAGGTVLATQWVPFKALVRIDEAIAMKAGGPAEVTYRELGKSSARLNLEGCYRSFIATEPHRFFEKSALLHERFQNFGKSSYEKTGERSGRVSMLEYPVFSPVFCSTALGYYEEALLLMHAPGPIQVAESSCYCAGGPACVFELRW